MVTQTRPENKARSFGQNIESDLASRFLPASSKWPPSPRPEPWGEGERKNFPSQVATEAMRQTMDCHPDAWNDRHFENGEGERDRRLPSLYCHRRKGSGGWNFPMARMVPEVDIAVDPLEEDESLRHRGTRIDYCTRCLRTRRPA